MVPDKSQTSDISHSSHHNSTAAQTASAMLVSPAVAVCPAEKPGLYKNEQHDTSKQEPSTVNILAFGSNIKHKVFVTENFQFSRELCVCVCVIYKISRQILANVTTEQL